MKKLLSRNVKLHAYISQLILTLTPLVIVSVCYITLLIFILSFIFYFLFETRSIKKKIKKMKPK